MANQRYRIVHTDVSNNSLLTDLDQVISIDVNEGIGKRADTFSFNILRKNLPSSVELAAEDQIDIYLGNGGGTPTNLVHSGKIKELKLSLTVDNCSLVTVSGQNKLESLLNQIRGVPYKAKTASFIVDDIINYANATNSPSDTDFGTGSITTTAISRDYYKGDITLFQQIEGVSVNEYTGNGTFVFYMDSANNFVWKPRSTTPVATLLRESVDFISMEPEQAIYNVINWLIIHAGNDLNGSPIRVWAINAASIGKYGPKQKYVAWTQIAKEYIDKNPGASNSTVRDAVRTIAKGIGNSVIRETGLPSWRLRGSVRGRTDLLKGELYIIESPSLGWTGVAKRKLRLSEMRHQYSSTTGWRMDLVFIEDEDSALQNFDEGI